MKNRIIQISITAIFFFGLLAILKFNFKTSDLALIVLIVSVLIAILIKVLFVGLVNPPDWLFRMRFLIMGIGSGIFIGILLFTMEAIKDALISHDLLKYILMGAIFGGLFNNSIIFSKSQRLKKRKGVFLLERQLIKDFAKIIVPNGERFSGRLILTNNKLIFLSHKNEDKLFEKDLGEINPVINTYSFLGIPNGFRIENEQDLIIKIAFPYYWLKRIEKRKRIKTTT